MLFTSHNSTNDVSAQTLRYNKSQVVVYEDIAQSCIVLLQDLVSAAPLCFWPPFPTPGLPASLEAGFPAHENALLRSFSVSLHLRPWITIRAHAALRPILHLSRLSLQFNFRQSPVPRQNLQGQVTHTVAASCRPIHSFKATKKLENNQHTTQQFIGGSRIFRGG